MNDVQMKFACTMLAYWMLAALCSSIRCKQVFLTAAAVVCTFGIFQ